jgi:hypothetical protein
MPSTYYVGPGGNNGNAGTSWALRKLTLNGAEDIPVVAGDIVYVGAGTYRELLTVDVSGGNLYTTGTVSVTNGSAVVTGSGTTWSTNVYANGIFQVGVLASGTDGVTTAVTATSHTFTSAAGNFQAGHVGYAIRIDTIGAYLITGFTNATTITVAKPDNSSFLMTAGTGLTYNVGPESPYEILSVDSDTQITLKSAWSAPSFTGLAYNTWRDIKFIGDYTGANTDGVGGVVRVTGSDNDLTATRNNCVTATSRSYRTFEGLHFDMTAQAVFVTATAVTGFIVRKCYAYCGATASIGAFVFSGTPSLCTVERSLVIASRAGSGVQFSNGSTLGNIAGLVQNCLIYGYGNSSTFGVRIDRVGGVTVRNNFDGYNDTLVSISAALATGQTTHVYNNLFESSRNGLSATAAGEITEDYNNFWNCASARANTLTGANSTAKPTFFDNRWFFQSVYAGAYPDAEQVLTPYDLASYSQLLNVAGKNPPLTDLRGTAVQGAQREWGALEYDSTLSIKARQAASVDGGGMVVS